jgi:hypothetical protein
MGRGEPKHAIDCSVLLAVPHSLDDMLAAAEEIMKMACGRHEAAEAA